MPAADGRDRVRVAPEGWRFIAIGGLVTALAAFYGAWPLTLLGLALTAFLVNFFRDPEREIPPGDALVTSPADGKVVAVLDGVEAPRYLEHPCRRISIFMSPLNVHVNRMPVSGRVVAVEHTAGKFHAAFLDKASEFNERNAVVVEDARGERILFVQIAGQLARRIVCRAAPGQDVRRGERYGMIMFGSRLDVYLPLGVEVRVKVGDRVAAGSSVLGAYT
jgi:phosphatidylserine decarboxylase